MHNTGTVSTVKKLLHHKEKPSAVLVMRYPLSATLIVHTCNSTLKGYIVFYIHLIHISHFNQNTSKCSYNLFLTIEQTGRISLASFNDLQSHTHYQTEIAYVK